MKQMGNSVVREVIISNVDMIIIYIYEMYCSASKIYMQSQSDRDLSVFGEISID